MTKRRLAKHRVTIPPAAVEAFRVGDLDGAQRALGPAFRPWWPRLSWLDEVTPGTWPPGADAVADARDMLDRLREAAAPPDRWSQCR